MWVAHSMNILKGCVEKSSSLFDCYFYPRPMTGYEKNQISLDV